MIGERESRSATGSPGRSERWGVWGAMSGPPTSKNAWEKMLAFLGRHLKK